MSEWFRHDKDMRNDLRIKALRAEFGPTGYAVWTWMLEILCDTEERVIKWDETNRLLLAYDFGVKQNKLEEIVAFMIKLELVQLKDNALRSDNFNKRMQKCDETREKNSEAGKRSAAARAARKAAEAAQNSNEIEHNSNTRSTLVQHSFNDTATDVQQTREDKRRQENNTFSSFSSFSSDEKDEKRTITKIFFFDKNWINPLEETGNFFDYNEDWDNLTTGQKNQAVKKWKQMGPEAGRTRFSQAFLAMWLQLYNKLLELDAPDIILWDALSDKLSWNECNTPKHYHRLTCTTALMKFIESNLDSFKPILQGYNNGNLGDLQYTLIDHA